MIDFLIFLVPSGVMEKWNYERFPDISGAFWCVGKYEIIGEFFICLGLSGVLKRVDISGAFWCAGNG